MATKNVLQTASKSRNLIRIVYLYLVCAITMVMVIIAGVQAVRIGLDTYVFKIDTPRYWYNECIDPKSSIDGRTVEERTPEEQAECEKRAAEKAYEQLVQERKHDISWALSMLLVASPLYLYHWRVVQKGGK